MNKKFLFILFSFSAYLFFYHTTQTCILNPSLTCKKKVQQQLMKIDFGKKNERRSGQQGRHIRIPVGEYSEHETVSI
jgi:hypothetical protein